MPAIRFPHEPGSPGIQAARCNGIAGRLGSCHFRCGKPAQCSRDFDEESDPTLGRERVARLREWLAANGSRRLHRAARGRAPGRICAARSERLKWLTGFSGSAGVAIVLANRAVIFVDGRYTLQVRDQIDPQVFTIESLVDNPPPKWIKANLGQGRPAWLRSVAAHDRRRQGADCRRRQRSALSSFRLPPIRSTSLWADQPNAAARARRNPSDRLRRRTRQGQARAARRRDRQGRRDACGADRSVLASPGPSTFAARTCRTRRWRSALPCSRRKGRTCFSWTSASCRSKTEAYLTQLADLRPPSALEAEIAALAKGGAKIALDPVLAADRLRTLVTENGGAVVTAPDPARIPRATKNSAEIAGARAAHRRDGAAVAKLLCWLDSQAPDTLDEIAVVTKLEEMRRVTGDETQMPLREVSFATIAGAGPNGAIMHYRVSRKHQPAAEAAASFSCSIPAGSTRTARPTSPAPCRSASRPRRCARATRWC